MKRVWMFAVRLVSFAQSLQTSQWPVESVCSACNIDWPCNRLDVSKLRARCRLLGVSMPGGRRDMSGGGAHVMQSIWMDKRDQQWKRWSLSVSVRKYDASFSTQTIHLSEHTSRSYSTYVSCLNERRTATFLQHTQARWSTKRPI